MKRIFQWTLVALAVGVFVVTARPAESQSPFDFDHGPIRYTSSAPRDPINKLQAKIDSGEVSLRFDPQRGYLPDILEQLSIPRSSQSLVFSKTSLQLFLIAPETPRALYFNDDVYVGSVQGSKTLEFAAMDPELGAIFYTLNDKDTPKPQFQREFLACLLCHDTAVTNNVPGLMALSVLTDKDGNAISVAGTAAMNDRTPMKERFGGWYVTGTHGAQRHWGNLTVPATKDTIGDAKSYIRRLDLEPGANVTRLDGRIETSRYLTPDSDIAAVLLMTHQTRIHNLITRTRYDVLSANDDPQKIRVAVEPLVRAMLFVWEAGFENPVKGSTSYAADFEKKGPFDRNGRSLRQLDLNTRLLRYPLSYLVYSDQFAALQPVARAQFFTRVREVLTGSDQSRDFEHLSKADRQAILEILTETRPEFATVQSGN
jgi:hypothetical protein